MLSVVSWGDPANPPVLLVHGYMDSAATFILLVDQLPDTFYYVGFDMPGKWLSILIQLYILCIHVAI